jgi:cell division protein FtsB
VAALASAMALYAFWGGEYSTGDLMALRRQERTERDRIAVLERELDSLQRLDSLVRNDPATQERLAREHFGMIREGEILYQVVPADSSR